MTKLGTLVAVGALILAACGGAPETVPQTFEDSTTTAVVQQNSTTQQVVSTTTTVPETTTTQQVTSTTTTVPQTTSTVPETTTTQQVTSTTTTVPQTTTTVNVSSECPDCSDSATDEDREYVVSMRILEPLYDPNFVTGMDAAAIIDMGRTVCVGLDGSYEGSFDSALQAMQMIYGFPSGAQTFLAIAAIEQAVRVYCPKFTDDWIDWAGSEPYDPFE